MKIKVYLIVLIVALLATLGCKKEKSVYYMSAAEVVLNSPENGTIVSSINSVVLEWDELAAGDGVYIISTLYCDEDTSNWQPIDPNGIEKHTLTNYCQMSKKYYWKVEVQNSDYYGKGNVYVDKTINSSPIFHFFTSPPGVKELRDTSGSGFVTLMWDEPENTNHIEIKYQVGEGEISEPVSVAAGKQKKEFTGLTDEVIHTFYIQTVDNHGNSSIVDTVKVIPLTSNKAFDADMNIYNKTVIGDQIWLRENLRTSKWLDGTPIPENTFYNLNDEYYYTQTIGELDMDPNKVVSYYTRTEEICPASFHVANDEDWKKLERQLGMKEEEVNAPNGLNPRGEDVGAGRALKSTSGWDNDGNGPDLFFFNAQPLGYSDGSAVEHIGTLARFWSIKVGDDFDRTRIIKSESDGIWILFTLVTLGVPVRCVKDK